MDWDIYFTVDSHNGTITWKKRPLHHFSSTRVMNIWNAKNAYKIAGSLKGGRTPYYCVQIDGKKYTNHRIIWEMINGKISDGLFIDHIDGNALNNSIKNLRVVTNAENSKNQRIRRTNTSGCMGVYFNKALSKWAADITTVKGKRTHIGYYADKDQAIKARKQAELENGYHANHGRVA